MKEPPQLRPRPKSWMNRNWKWFVPTVGIGALAVVISFFVVALFLATALIKNSGAYTKAVAAATNDQRVIAALGPPVKEGILPWGSIQMSGTSGEADLEIPLRGSKGKGKLYVKATKAVGTWQFSDLIFETPGKERIDLKDKANER